MIAVVTASTVMAYALYTMAPETQARLGHDALADRRSRSSSTGSSVISTSCIGASWAATPPSTFLTDRALLLDVALWSAAVIAILYVAP